MGGGAEEMEREGSVAEGGNIWNKPLPDDVTTVAIQTIQLLNRKNLRSKTFAKISDYGTFPVAVATTRSFLMLNWSRTTRSSSERSRLGRPLF